MIQFAPHKEQNVLTLQTPKFNAERQGLPNRRLSAFC